MYLEMLNWMHVADTGAGLTYISCLSAQVRKFEKCKCLLKFNTSFTKLAPVVACEMRSWIPAKDAVLDLHLSFMFTLYF